MPTMAMRNALVVINHKAMLSEMTLKIWTIVNKVDTKKENKKEKVKF